MAPYSKMVEQALTTLHSELVHTGSFARQEDDDVQGELAVRNDLLNHVKNESFKTHSDEI